jgi:hypothetical protein
MHISPSLLTLVEFLTALKLPACNPRLQYLFGRKNDVLGIGASWGDPFDPAQRNQHGGEVYYRLQLTNDVAVTPHVQFIFDPVFPP